MNEYSGAPRGEENQFETLEECEAALSSFPDVITARIGDGPCVVNESEILFHPGKYFSESGSAVCRAVDDFSRFFFSVVQGKQQQSYGG